MEEQIAKLKGGNLRLYQALVAGEMMVARSILQGWCASMDDEREAVKRYNRIHALAAPLWRNPKTNY